MNILFIVKEFPHSRVIGGPVIIYNRIKYLSREHTVSCIAFAPEEPTDEQVESLGRYCKELRLVPSPGPRGALERARGWLAGPVPPYFMLNYSKQMYKELREMAHSMPYDVIISEYSMVAQYLYRNPDLEGMKRVMSVHECYYLARKKVLEVEGCSREGMRAVMQLKGLKRYEFDIYADADKVLTLTPEGRDELLAVRRGLDISVVPHGVDVEGFRPAASKPEGKPTVMFLGNFPHDPNRDAMVVFAREGKVLEAMAAGVPVVSTRLGAEGLPASDGENILLAEGAADLARQTVRLLSEPGLSDRIAGSARQLMVDRFSWQKGVEILEGVLEEVVSRP
jgi:glycosyltransferase involved in cell wall biosynthesis